MFRFIHTSDWHLGQSFMNQSREDEHRYFLNWLIKEIATQKVDALIIAGDIFDTGTPPSYARRLYYNFLKELNHQCQIPVIVIGGNHDSISTLNESGTLLRLLDIHVIGGKKSAKEETILLQDRTGANGAIICAVPFLRDRDVRLSSEGESFDSKKEALRLGIKKHYSECLEVAKSIDAELPIIATGHLTTSGGKITEGVRDIYIGSLESYDSSEFPNEFDYIALGHLHTNQSFGKRKHIRYCGSPIPISFSEANKPKIINLVEIEKKQVPVIHELEVPTSRHLESFSGSLDEIEKRLNNIPTNSPLTPWLEIVIPENTELSAAQALIKNHIQNLDLEVLRFRRSRKRKTHSNSTPKEITLQEMSVEDVFQQKIKLTDFDNELKKKLTNAFLEVYNKAERGEDS